MKLPLHRKAHLNGGRGILEGDHECVTFGFDFVPPELSDGRAKQIVVLHQRTLKILTKEFPEGS
jgi:hypothetical protein